MTAREGSAGAAGGRIVVLDRDGVLNDMVVHPEHGTVDSPLNPSEVRVLPGVPEALRLLNASGYRLFIATNQPAARKGKTSPSNLLSVHEAVVSEAEGLGGRIEESFICWDREEDNSFFRKPRPGMLLQAIERVPGADLDSSWMVGDGVVDIEAGKAAGLRTAFIGSARCSTCKVLGDRDAMPDRFFASLLDFATFVAGSGDRS